MSSPLLGRGVYLAPSLGPNGESILYAVRSNHRRFVGGEILVPVGENPLDAMEHLWTLLDLADPPMAAVRLA